MTEKDKILYSINIHDEKENLDFFKHYNEAICNLITQITEKLAEAKTQIKKHEDYYETHYFKFVLQSLTLRHLFDGTPLKLIKPGHSYIDISSIYSLTRSLMESFLTINYLYYNPKSEDQANFRYLLYIASGLNSRQKFPVNSEASKKKQEAERQEIEAILSEIKENKHFSTIHPDKQKHIFGKMLAYEIGMKEVIDESGLDKGIFHTLWSLYSNYSHSEQLEAMQLREYIKDTKGYSGTIFGTYRISFMLICFQIIKLTERFELAKEIFDSQSLDIKTIIEFYNSIILGLKLEKHDSAS